MVFDSEGSYVENKGNGEINWLTKKDNLWTIRLWVGEEQGVRDERAADVGTEEDRRLRTLMDFQRQGRNP